MKLQLSSRAWPIFLALLLVEAARAQGEVWTFPGGAAAAVGDATGDGVADFVTIRDDAVGGANSVAEVRSGADGVVVCRYGPAAGSPALRAPRGIGDVNGDGAADFAAVEWAAVGATVVTRAVVVSGSSGQLLHAVNAPSSDLHFSVFEPIGDFDGDGAPDYAAGLTIGAVVSPPYPAGQVWLISGATGQPIRAIVSPSLNTTWGAALARFDDLDGDGVRDLAVGSRERVDIVSLSNATPLFTVENNDVPLGFGSAIAVIEDVDGDGRSELAVAAPGTYASANPSSTCALYLYSVPGGALLQTWKGAPQQRRLGRLVASAGDFDGDGAGDVLYSTGVFQIGCCAYSDGWVEIVSGRTGVALYQGPGGEANTLDAFGDFDGDGSVDYAVGGYFTQNSTPGAGVVLTRKLPPTTVFECSPGFAFNTNSLGCSPRMQALGAPSFTIGAPFSLHASAFRNRVSAAMVASAGWAAGTPFAQQRLCLLGARRVIQATSTGGSANGNDCTGALDAPLSPTRMMQLGWTPGSTFTVQCWARDPGFVAHDEISLSDALWVTVWP